MVYVKEGLEVVVVVDDYSKVWRFVGRALVVGEIVEIWLVGVDGPDVIDVVVRNVGRCGVKDKKDKVIEHSSLRLVGSWIDFDHLEHPQVGLAA